MQASSGVSARLAGAHPHRLLDDAAPAGVDHVDQLGRQFRRDVRSGSHSAASSSSEDHTPSASPATVAAPSASRLQRAGPGDGHAALLGLQLEEEVHGGGTPVGPQRGQGVSRGGGHGIGHVAHLEGHRLDAGPRRTAARPAPRVRPVAGQRARGSHHGLPRPVRAGTKVTPPLSGTDDASGPCPRRRR